MTIVIPDIGTVEATAIGGAITLVGRSLIGLLATIWRDIKDSNNRVFAINDKLFVMAEKFGSVTTLVVERLEQVEEAVERNGKAV